MFIYFIENYVSSFIIMLESHGFAQPVYNI